MHLGQVQASLHAAGRSARRRIKHHLELAPPGVKDALKHLEKNLFDPDLSVSRLRREYPLSSRALDKFFRHELSATPGQYIRERRLETAAGLLRATLLPMNTVAGLVGYGSFEAFSRAFARWSGERPQAFRGQPPSGAPPAARIHEELPSERILANAFFGTLDKKDAGALIAALRDRSQGSLSTTENRVEVSSELATPTGVAERAWAAIWARSMGDRIDGRGVTPFSWGPLFEELTIASRELGRGNRQRGVRLAELALSCLDLGRETLPEASRNDMEALGWAWLGNARRLATDLPGAERACRLAEQVISSGSCERSTVGTVLIVKASFRWYQRRHEEALELADRAIALLRTLDAPVLLPRVFIQRAAIYVFLGKSERSISDLREALCMIEVNREPDAAVSAHHMLAAQVMLCGLPHEASEHLGKARSLCERFKLGVYLPLITWLEGFLSFNLEDFEGAEGSLLAAREMLAESGERGQVAMISLDLALVYVAQRRPLDAGRAVAKVLPILSQLQFRSEALVALRVLESAVGQGEVSLFVLRDVLGPLSKALKSPHENCRRALVENLEGRGEVAASEVVS